MWIHTEQGFVSIVDEPDRPADELLLRARARADLILLGVPSASVWWDERADYQWRARMPRVWVAKKIAESILAIEYRNFKDRIAETRGVDRASTLHDVWAAFLRIEDEPASRVDAAVYGVGDGHAVVG